MIVCHPTEQEIEWFFSQIAFPQIKEYFVLNPYASDKKVFDSKLKS